MTTVILTIIGIFLAGIAALMVTYYGTASWEEGTTSAHASTLINAGENVVASDQLFYNRDGRKSVDLTDLIDAQYLNSLPNVPNGTVQETYADLTDTSGLTKRAFVITNVSQNVCLEVEKRISDMSATAIPTSADNQIGCYVGNAGNTFYAKLV